MNEESSTQTERKRLERSRLAHSLVVSQYPGLFFFLREKGSSKRLVAVSFFAYEDKRMAARVLHLSAFIITIDAATFAIILSKNMLATTVAINREEIMSP